ncbi:hypothetical protein OTU49_000790, partial [Cherax quadricarinatus]
QQLQYTGARDSGGMQRSLSHATFLLAVLLGCCQASTTLRPTSASTLSSTPTTTTVEDTKGVTTASTASITSKTTAGDVLEEVSRLLNKLREVAASMQEARDEHERLSQAVAQITAAVKDMGEHNLHIKKKVRKMSKGLKRNSHNRKIKDGLKSLQRDHQRILHAMSLSGINITRIHNHTRKHNLTHPHTPAHKKDHGRNRKNHEASVVELTTKAAEVPQETVRPDKDHELKKPMEEETEVTDNLIPELVVDPPSATDPPLPVDCTEVIQRGNWTSGVYMVQPKGLQPLK